ncbi:MAG: hypothetical protein AAGD22_10030 [Verrucomicrobiota bacterium]
MSSTPTATADRVATIRSAIPSEGLFADKNWRLSPEPFPLSKKQVRTLEALGPILHTFQKAANNLYHRSLKASAPEWIAQYIDAGKPPELLKHAHSKALRHSTPRVIRPDLILTENEGFALTELDSVPGGIGLTAWLNQTFANALGLENIVGGPKGMLHGFAGIFPNGADIVVSNEAADYRPEMEWLANNLKNTSSPNWQVHPAESYSPKPHNCLYRFFELFDLENIPFTNQAVTLQEKDELCMSPPLKPAIEEKLWLALFWSKPLEDFWRRELRDSNFQKLRNIIPYGWVVDPAPVPHHAVIPRLEIPDFNALGDLTQKERDLVLKISGFSELAWGSRGVHIGSDLPQSEWQNAVSTALTSINSNPYLLQEFKKGARIQHPFYDDQSQSLQSLDARVRLCPYYFVHPPKSDDSSSKESVHLGGVLATIVPADKKKLHGMSDAILVPCALASD